MTITLKALEDACGEIEKIGHGEIDFAVGKTKVVLRVVSPEEDDSIQAKAQEALEDEEEGGLRYFNAYKLALLTRAIVQIGDQDLRDVQYIETEETLGNEKKVQVEKHLALAPLVKKWGAVVRTGMFRKYAELILKVEKEGEKAIQFDPTDLSAEIERTERRLENLKDEFKKLKTPLEDGHSAMVKKVAAIDEEEFIQSEDAKTQHVIQTNRPEEPAPVVESAPAPQPVQATPQERRRPIIPASGRPPEPPPSMETAGVAEALTGDAAAAALVEQQGSTFDQIQDSFVDTGDPDSMSAAIEAENQRLLAARQRSGAARATETESGMRRPPHQAAAETAATLVGVKSAADLDEATLKREMTYMGKTEDGIETFKLPVEELSKPANPQPVAPAPPVQFNPTAQRGTLNPRFRPQEQLSDRGSIDPDPRKR